MRHSLPDGWRRVRLGDVLEQQFRPEQLAVDTDYKTLGVRWYGNGVFIKNERDGDDISSSYLNRVAAHDFIYNRLFAWKGSFAIVPPEYDKLYVSNEFPLFQVADQDTLLLEYLLWYAKQEWYWEKLASFSTGTTSTSRLRYKEEDFLREVIPLPPLDEQRQIAAMLRDADATIARVEDAIAAAQTVKRGVMRRLFTYGLGDESTPTKHTPIGEIPAEWGVAPLEEHLKQIQYGLSLKAEFQSGRYPILRMNNLGDGYVYTADLKYVDVDDNTFEQYRLHRKDLLFNRTNSTDLVGKTAIFLAEGDYVFASYLLRLTTNLQHLQPEFLNYYFNFSATQARLKALATQGVSQSNINAANLKMFEVPLPTLNEQREIAAILQTHDDAIHAMQAERDSLRAVKRGLMQGLLSGKLRTSP